MPYPIRDEKVLKKLERMLNQKTPKTVASILAALGISRRSLFRYFQILISRGLDVRRVGISRPTLYRINGRKK